MATVCAGHDERLGRPVAIKLLAENLANDPELRDRFVREARLAARLNHPNVVKLFDAGEDGRPYIVMEHVEGETLAERLGRSGRLPPAEAVAIALQACAGLECAHRAGIVHRDVKPRNMLLGADGVVRIADFGIARALEETRLTQIGTVLGTLAYLAPEQASGEEVTAAADLYSLGAVLYEALTGRAPYESDTLVGLIAKQQSGALEPLRTHEPAVPEELERIVMGCLATDPKARPESAAALARELEAFASGPTVPLTRPPSDWTMPLTPAARSRPSLRLSRSWALGLAGAAAALGTALALAFAAGSESDDPGGSPAARPPAPPPPAAQAPARAQTPAERARDLARWLRANSE